MQLFTYLNYGGNCEPAFRFYEQHFGGKIEMIMHHGENPGGNAPEHWRGKVMYARMSIGGTVLMGSDVPDKFEPMRSAYLFMNFDNTQEVERAWKLLTEGGQIFMPMEETFFAIRFGVVRDKFGTNWMVIQERPRQ